MFKNLHLSKAFGLAMSIVYAYCLFLSYTFSILLVGLLDPDTATQYYIAMKITSVRLMVLVFGLIAYPIILSRFLKYAKYVTVALTAWAIIMYFEDYFVLYALVEYPELGSSTLLQALRPILIVSLIWMSFELTFSPQPRD